MRDFLILALLTAKLGAMLILVVIVLTVGMIWKR